VNVNSGVRIVGWLAVVALLGPSGWPATAHDKGASAHGFSGRATENCARECLEGIARKYMDALVQRNPSAAPLAEHVKFTENNVELRVGDGLWGTITGKGPPATELLFADPEQGQVGFFGIVDEHGVPGYIGVRLKIEDRKISEIETVINRIPPLPPGAKPPPFATRTPQELQHFAAMSEAAPAGERVSRGRLIDIANGYFSTLQQNDGQLFTPFADDCSRLENGNITAGAPIGSTASCAPAASCWSMKSASSF
jgi:hypothetical protein